LPKDVDDLKPLGSLVFYLFLLGFASFRILESFSDGYLRAPKYDGTASPGESGYWVFLVMYGVMILVAILGLVDLSRRKKSSTDARTTRDRD
jgi:divalent metal cation (Fe/Co/Zn/Cd) transporter